MESITSCGEESLVGMRNISNMRFEPKLSPPSGSLLPRDDNEASECENSYGDSYSKSKNHNLSEEHHFGLAAATDESLDQEVEANIRCQQNAGRKDENIGDDRGLFERTKLKERCYVAFPVGFAIFICVCLLASSSRPFEMRMARRKLPLSSRRIQWRISSYFASSDAKGRHLDENGDNGDDGNNIDDAKEYYDMEPVYIEDDFFRFIDDDILDDEKNLLPLDASDILGFLCASMSLILAVGGGIGPGAILVALYIILMEFPAKAAIPLSCITGLGVSIASTFINSSKRHPLTDRPIIDWDLILIMEPLTLLGAISGTYLNKLLQEKILVTMLVLLLSVISHHTLKKARKMFYAEEVYIKRVQWHKAKKENMHKALYHASTFQNGLAEEADPPFVPRVLTNSKQSTPTGAEGANVPFIPHHDSPKESVKQSKSKKPFVVVKLKDAESVKSSLIEEEAEPLPQNKITYIVAMFLFVIAMNAFKGGGSFESPLGITCGSISFWIVDIMTSIWLIGCTYLAGTYLLRRHAIKEAVGFDYVRGDIRWDIRTIVIYPSTCIVAGLVSGMFGIGSAIVTAPMMIGIGVNPSVAAATSGCMNFFTSLAATSSFVVLGSLIPDYAVTCLLIGFSATYFGKYIMSQAFSAKRKKNKKLERHSYITYSMGAVVFLSALLMTAEVLWSTFHHSYDDVEIEGICDDVE